MSLPQISHLLELGLPFYMTPSPVCTKEGHRVTGVSVHHRINSEALCSPFLELQVQGILRNLNTIWGQCHSAHPICTTPGCPHTPSHLWTLYHFLNIDRHFWSPIRRIGNPRPP